MPEAFTIPPQSDDSGQEVVRSFSRKATDEFPEDELATSLAVKEARDENEEQRKRSLAYLWQDLFKTGEVAITHNGTVEDRALDQASRELAQAWLGFQKCLPDGHRSKVEDSPPRLEDVYRAVTVASDQLKTNREQSKFGKLKGRFNKLCDNLNNHKDLFDIVPDGDKYISILAGSFSALVKASARYERIGESVNRALEELSDRLPYWHRQMKIHRGNAFMERYIALLYVAIFRFLTDVMKEWFKSGWHRLRHAFNTEFIDRRLNMATDEIKNLSEKLEKEAKLATEAKIQMMPTSGDFATWMRQFQDELYSRMGETVQKQLRCEYENHFAQVMNMVAARTPSPMPAITGDESIRSITADVVQEDWSKLAAPLEKYNQKELLQDLVERSQNLHINFEILLHIQSWFQEPVSKTLWICGPFQAPVPSRMTLTSAYIFDVADKAKVPVIAYFYDHSDSGNSGKPFLSMMHSLIFQVSKYMENRPNTDWAAIRAKFDKLDGSMDSLNTALSLLELLVKDGPELLFCIIDGFQDIAYRLKDSPEVHRLLEILRPRPDSDASKIKPFIKTLFTTDGFTDALSHLHADERLDVLDFARDNEVEFGPGQSPMSFLNF